MISVMSSIMQRAHSVTSKTRVLTEYVKCQSHRRYKDGLHVYAEDSYTVKPLRSTIAKT